MRWSVLEPWPGPGPRGGLTDLPNSGTSAIAHIVEKMFLSIRRMADGVWAMADGSAGSPRGQPLRNLVDLALGTGENRIDRHTSAIAHTPSAITHIVKNISKCL